MDGRKKSPIARFFSAIGNGIKLIGTTFRDGDWKTRISYLIMGFGPILRGAILRGIGFLACEIGAICYMVFFGWNYLKDIGTLGTKTSGFNADGTKSYGDNSFMILLFGILSIIVILMVVFLWYLNIKENDREQKLIREGKEIPSFKKDLSSLVDGNFDKTLLAIPVIGVFVFVVLPIIFMICVAFTNYDYNHQSPSKLFTWVGFENFGNLFSLDTKGFGQTFGTVLGWTLIWALFATFLTYFLGMGVAILINRKGVKFKKVWRTILVMTIAVPQFVSLLYVYKLFAGDGLINSYLMKWGWITDQIPFWTDPTLAKITIILVNCWIGIPYTMLIVTGLLMNIPEDLYESARIDGANAWQTFKSITLPYMLFVTGPFLLTQYTANLNNFNVIFLLTQGKPQSQVLNGGAGYTDLLVTWLYKMTVNDSNYRMAAVIGIMVFVVTAVISLVVYGLLPSVKDEEGFQ